MYTNISLEEVLKSVDDFLVNVGFSDNTLYTYRHCGFAFFREGFSVAGCYLYSEELSESLVTALYQQMMTTSQNAGRKFRLIRRVHEMMKDYAKNGKIHYPTFPFLTVKHPCKKLEKILENYLSDMQKAGYSELTIRSTCSAIRNFLLYMESQDICTFNDLSNDDVECYFPILYKKWASGISTPLHYLRGFFSYLYEKKETAMDLSLVLNVTTPQKNKIKQGFDMDEINAMLAVVDQNTSLGKRDFAMITLAVHSGLRQIDVLNLKLQDIHWKEAEIRIIQKKNNRQLILPLDQETGDAIAEYILHGRPISDSPFVFLRSVAPYTNLKVGSCIGSRIVQKYAALAGVTWTKEERKGFHSFRRTIGRELLVSDVPLHTIKEIMGHADQNSTKQYLSIDMKHLQECALSLNQFICTKEAFR